MRSERFGNIVEQIVCAHVATARVLALGSLTGALVALLPGLAVALAVGAALGVDWVQAVGALQPDAVRAAPDATRALLALPAVVAGGAVAAAPAALAHRSAVRATGIAAPGALGHVVDRALGWLRGHADVAVALAFDVTAAPLLALGIRAGRPDLPWAWPILGGLAVAVVAATPLALVWLMLYRRALLRFSGVDWVAIMGQQVRERYGDDWRKYNERMAHDLRDAARRRVSRRDSEEGRRL
jgi:hypothetical protein